MAVVAITHVFASTAKGKRGDRQPSTLRHVVGGVLMGRRRVTGTLLSVAFSVTVLCVSASPLSCAPTYSITDVGTLEGAGSWVYGLNDAGQVVGTSFDRAFLWEADTMYDLNDLVPTGSGWMLYDARGINGVRTDLRHRDEPRREDPRLPANADGCKPRPDHCSRAFPGRAAADCGGIGAGGLQEAKAGLRHLSPAFALHGGRANGTSPLGAYKRGAVQKDRTPRL